MFNLFGGKKIPTDLSKIRTEHIALLVKRDGKVEARKIAKLAAIVGNLDCAVFISDLLKSTLDATSLTIS